MLCAAIKPLYIRLKPKGTCRHADGKCLLLFFIPKQTLEQKRVIPRAVGNVIHIDGFIDELVNTNIFVCNHIAIAAVA